MEPQQVRYWAESWDFSSVWYFQNVIFSLIVGLLLVVPGIRKYRDYLKDKRMKNLLYQFRDMMESLSASYSAGKNTQGAFFGCLRRSDRNLWRKKQIL